MYYFDGVMVKLAIG